MPFFYPLLALFLNHGPSRYPSRRLFFLFLFLFSFSLFFFSPFILTVWICVSFRIIVAWLGDHNQRLCFVNLLGSLENASIKKGELLTVKNKNQKFLFKSRRSRKRKWKGERSKEKLKKGRFEDDENSQLGNSRRTLNRTTTLLNTFHQVPLPQRLPLTTNDSRLQLHPSSTLAPTSLFRLGSFPFYFPCVFLNFLPLKKPYS